MWVRGLKLFRLRFYKMNKVSHPMWVRGLKQHYAYKQRHQHQVAPHVGAWIETRIDLNYSTSELSHPMWVRGLKQTPKVDQPLQTCRTPCGCVD